MSGSPDCAILQPSPSRLSDDDAFNTVGARLHFGPIRSPEKMFASIGGRTPTCTNPTPHPSTTLPTLTQSVFKAATTIGSNKETKTSSMESTNASQPSLPGVIDHDNLSKSEEILASGDAARDIPPQVPGIYSPPPQSGNVLSADDREQSPLSETGIDTRNVADALIPDSPSTPKASLPQKVSQAQLPATSTPLTEAELPNHSSQQGCEIAKRFGAEPSDPPHIEDPQSNLDTSTPRASTTPTRPRPSVATLIATDRELKSLSPTSNHLLGQLLSTPGKPPQRILRFSTTEDSLASTSPPNTFLQRPTFALQTPQRTPRPFPSPLRSVRPSSPAKRPPQEGAPDRKSSIPEPSTSIFARTAGAESLLSGTPGKSPVRRLPAPVQASTPPHKPAQKIQSTAGKPSLPSTKAVDFSPNKSTAGSKLRIYASKSAQSTASLAPPSSLSTSKSLPFPIGPVRTFSRRSPSTDIESGSNAEQPLSSPDQPEMPKSHLKQSSSSRIPRPKPYSRPIPSARRTLANRHPTDDKHPLLNEDNTPEQRQLDTPQELSTLATQIQSNNLEVAFPLKRKRPSEPISDRDDQGPDATDSHRQPKMPRRLNEVFPTTSKSLSTIVPTHQPTTASVRTLDEELAAATASSEPENTSSDPEGLPSSSPPSSSNELPSEDLPQVQESLARSPEVPPIAAYLGVPRRGRTRKALDLSGGPVSLGARTIRRRAVGNQLIPPSDSFCGLSAVALKALTTENTAKNERYLAIKLETEVIRKEGLRPDSPGIKARTSVQRQQEELQKQRQERADRRARRGGQGSDARQDLIDEVDEGDGFSDEEDDELDALASSPPGQRHRRGPGDEEDYETPHRPTRLSNDVTQNQDSHSIDRRVRWDRGLFTEVYLDEVKFGTRKRGDAPTAKGCLAPSAKALPLDNLGNLPEVPFPNLEQEQVTIKKFVYDNDIEPVPEPVVVKPVTRQRSKNANK